MKINKGMYIRFKNKINFNKRTIQFNEICSRKG